MEIKNKKTGYIFEIKDSEGKKLILNSDDEFEPVDKKYLPKRKKAKTVKEKVMGTDCIKALKKEQIIQELTEFGVNFDTKAKKSELVELLKKAGGY